MLSDKANVMTISYAIFSFFFVDFLLALVFKYILLVT